MVKMLFATILVLITTIAYAQEHSFPFGEISYKELGMAVYDKDTSAAAVVLNEFGEAYIDNYENNNLLFEYHGKIKILKKSGLSYADIEIPLWKQESRVETLRSIKASSFTLENGSIREVALPVKNVFTENRSQNLDVKKFAIPNVRVGSIIEFQYVLESPFKFNFRNWEFQSEIPKIYSEYWATIPAIYVYNMSLRGYLKLTKNENELLKECFTPGGQKADCALYKYGMKDIPAFVEEDFMTAKSNFVSAINFELSEAHGFDGRVVRYTKEWKDTELELRRHPEFGIQIKRGKDIMDEHLKLVIGGEVDPLLRAKKIYDFIKGWYRWDEIYSNYSELGIKKAFDQKMGNVGDINLSLIAALRYAGLNVEPVILSTRSHGMPTELHPVLSDFNYVIAKVNIGDKIYLVDATDDFYPFGVLPERCLNGKGRVLGENQSYWIDLKPTDRAKQLSQLTLKLEQDGVMRGMLQTTYIGYEAVSHRKKIHAFGTQQEYIADLDNALKRIDIKHYEIFNVEDLEKPLVQKLHIEVPVNADLEGGSFLFNPFLLGKTEENPFKSSERLYPVDFGTPLDYVTMLTLEYPAEFEIANIPENVGLSLPNGGGRYVYSVSNTANKFSLNHALNIGRTVFTSTEYHYLKELFNRIIQIQNEDLIFKKKG
jgi:hypothetical protein